MPRKFLIVAVLVAAAVCCAGFFMTSSDSDTERDGFDISYHGLGGADNSLNRTSYAPGEAFPLNPADRPGYRFGGWYLDSGLTELFMEVTPDTSGDLDLYAKWQDNIVGRQLTFSISGTVKDGIYKTYDVTGERTVTYKDYDDQIGYLVDYRTETVYDYGSAQYASADESCDWGQDRFFETAVVGTEVIDTVYGKVLCEVQVHKEREYENRLWIGKNDRVVYRAEETAEQYFGDAVFVYTLEKHTCVEVERHYRLIAFADSGITVTGGGEFEPGTDVTLEAEVEDGTVFIGWYDWYMNPLTYDTTLHLHTGHDDISVFAMNAEDPDFLGSTYETSSFDLGTDSDGTVWKVCPYGTRDTEFKGKGDCIECFFKEPGWYDVYIRDKGGDYCGYRTMYIGGEAVRDYVWMFEGMSYSMSVTIDYDDVLDYYTMMDADRRHCMISPMNRDHDHERSFLTWEDPYIQSMADDFRGMTRGMSDVQVAKFVLAFMGNIEYQSDEVFYAQPDYWKYPLETLFDMGGDCEDTSILYTSLMKAMGYDSALVIFPNHAMSAVKLDGEHSDYQYFREDGGARYYYVESTSDYEKFGELPDVVDVRDEIPVFI